MHVALCHNALVPPVKYGGTERILFWLAQGLNKLGHKTTLIAKQGSNVPGTRFIAFKEETSLDYLVPEDVDILHLWATPSTPPKRPFLVTIEGNGQEGEVFHSNTLFISAKHASNHGAHDFVFNGINVDAYSCSESRENYAVFLAKASWKVKNLEGAIAVARAAGMHLEVLGSRDWPMDLHRLLPTIRGVKYRGMVGDIEKRELLSRAKALIFPVRWHEPFGIAVTEALASGCAVLGTPYGSLPELVTQDVGLLSSDGNALVRALIELRNNSSPFQPKRCRQRVLDGLTHLDMARSYLKFYEAVMTNGTLRASPKTLSNCPGLSSKSLLPWTSPKT